MKRIFFYLVISFICFTNTLVHAETYTNDFKIRVLYLENVNYTTKDADGIEFEILEKDTLKLVGNYTTDKGYINVTLSTGEYIMNQITNIDGYYLNDGIKLSVNPKLSSQYIQAYLIKHNDEFIINNYDTSNKEITDSLFDIYEGDKVIYSNIKPFNKVKLNSGKYSVIQKSVSSDYSLNRECFFIEITGGGVSYRELTSSLKELNIINEFKDPNQVEEEIEVPNTLVYDFHYLLYLACIPILLKHEKV